MSDFQSLITPSTKLKVSSTLDKSVSKQYLTDGSPETCWTSQQGLPQYIQLSFPSPVIPRKIGITFQGGFVGTRCAVQISSRGDTQKNEWETLCYIFPEDVNRKQDFELVPADPTLLSGGIDGVRIVFEESSDFFGRITVYDIKLDGTLL